MKQFYHAIQEFNQKENVNQISVASGMAIYQQHIDQCFIDVFKRADNLMYQNKAIMKQAGKK